MNISLLGAAARKRQSTWSPLDIPWADLYWTEGPAFQALGLADGATLTTWPSEIPGGHTISTVAGTPHYRASAMVFNGHPAVQVAGTENMMNSTATSLTQPWAAVTIATSTSAGATIIGAQSGGSSQRGLGHGWLSAGILATVAVVPDSAAHLLVGVFQGATSRVERDNVLVATVDAGTVSVAQRQIFARSSSLAISPQSGYSFLNGYIGVDGDFADYMDALYTWTQVDGIL